MAMEFWDIIDELDDTEDYVNGEALSYQPSLGSFS
jgi:hypothetical protein